MPFVSACLDEIDTLRGARLAWLALTWTALAGLFVAVRAMLPAGPSRNADAALGTALLGTIPVFLEWSLQVRTDQIALAGGTWGTALLLISRRRAAWALLGGMAFGLGFIGSQKLAYLVAWGGLLFLGDAFVRNEFLRSATSAESGSWPPGPWRCWPDGGCS